MRKKILILGILAVSFVGFAQTESKEVEQNDSVMCQLYRIVIGDDSHGCGGGERICCANTKLNHI